MAGWTVMLLTAEELHVGDGGHRLYGFMCFRIPWYEVRSCV